MKIRLLLVVLFSGSLFSVTAQEQRFTEFGLTGGPVRFYPQAQHPGSGWASSMDNG